MISYQLVQFKSYISSWLRSLQRDLLFKKVEFSDIGQVVTFKLVVKITLPPVQIKPCETRFLLLTSAFSIITQQQPDLVMPNFFSFIFLCFVFFLVVTYSILPVFTQPNKYPSQTFRQHKPYVRSFNIISRKCS